MPVVLRAMRLNLDRAVEIDSESIRFDQVRMRQIARHESAAATNTRGIGKHMLKLHRAGELHARRVAENVVGRTEADEPERLNVVSDRGDDADRVVVDLVLRESSGGRVMTPIVLLRKSFCPISPVKAWRDDEPRSGTIDNVACELVRWPGQTARSRHRSVGYLHCDVGRACSRN